MWIHHTVVHRGAAHLAWCVWRGTGARPWLLYRTPSLAIAPSQALATAVPARVLERVTVRKPDIPAQHRSRGDPGHGYEVTRERLQLWAEPLKCLKVTEISDQITRYESTRAYTIHCGTYKSLPGDHTRLSWTKKLSKSFEMWNGGAGGTPARAWAVEACRERENVSLGTGWSPVEDATTTIVDESTGYDGTTPLGKTRMLGLKVPCRGPAHITPLPIPGQAAAKRSPRLAPVGLTTEMC